MTSFIFYEMPQHFKTDDFPAAEYETLIVKVHENACTVPLSTLNSQRFTPNQ